MNKVSQDIAIWFLLYDIYYVYITQKIPSLREKWDFCCLFGIILIYLCFGIRDNRNDAFISTSFLEVNHTVNQSK